MRAGDLDSRITVLVQDTRQDNIGQPLDVWMDFLSTWADIRYQSGLQRLSADAINAGTRCSIRVRRGNQTKLITIGMRIRANGEIFEILDVLPQDRVGIDLICEAVR